MRTFLKTLLIVVAAASAPAALHGQSSAVTRVDARLNMPEFLLLHVVDHAVTAEGAGRVELKVTANRNWTVSVNTKSPNVDYKVVGDTVGKTAHGAAGNNHKVVVEYEYRGRRPADRGTRSEAPLEYVISAR